MNKIIFNNERTLASAGSGKTYNLTNRIIALVAGGAKPKEICALTFTRKAAGEFFGKTMQKLAEAAQNDAYANSLSKDINKIAEIGELKKENFAIILEKFAKSLQNLNFSTIDSFTSKFLKLFTSELGINESVEILDEFSEGKAKEKALFETLRQFAGDSSTIAEFAQAIKEASFGKDKKMIVSTVGNFIDEAHFLYLLQPDKNRWISIIPKTPLIEWNSDKYRECTELLEKIFSEKGAKKKNSILTFFKNSDFDRVYNLGKLTSEMAEYFRKTSSARGTENIDEDEYPLIDQNIKRLLYSQTDASQKAASAIYKIVSAYEKIYDKTVRKQGLLSFNDMTISIAKSPNPVERKFAEYRFDSSTKHWLFDEFQDTSRLQWEVFKDIIDEAIQDPEKSFYFVGDIKQSIYGWRGGDMKLFGEIYEHYKKHMLDNEQMKTSYRSCPAVIDFVNKVFSNRPMMKTYFGENAENAWSKIWEDHDCAEKNLKQKGEVSVEVLEKSEEEDALGNAVYNYIKEKNPSARNLTCAVLVQTNKKALQIIEAIRAKVAAEKDGEKSNIRVASELDIYIAQDNLAIPAMLAFLKLSVHPQDSFAKNYVLMSPLSAVLQNENWDEELTKKISSLGFEKAFEPIAKILSENLKDFDGFTKNRISQFMEACKNFDEEQNRDADDFIDYIQKYKIREGAASDTIQVMSIHKSKGLDFDIVILPELGNTQGNRSSNVKSRNNGDVVYMPSKNICEFDENLKEASDEFKERENFEKLCKFYVALTRAKRAIHIILNKNKTETKSEGNGNFEHFLAKYFGIYEKGKDLRGLKTDLSDEAWIEDSPKKENLSEIEKSETPKEKYETKYGQIEFEFDFLNRNSANLTGLAAHSIFENLNGKKSLEEAALAAKNQYLDCPENFKDALELVKKSLENAKIKKIFECEDFCAELPYCILNGDDTECGRIDRVNFFENRTRAEIIDFKTDDASESELISRHSAQLKRYALALSKSSGIPIEKIGLKILSARNAKLVKVS